MRERGRRASRREGGKVGRSREEWEWKRSGERDGGEWEEGGRGGVREVGEWGENIQCRIIIALLAL